MKSSSVKIGALNISPPVFLAPMAGLTHSALRQLILDFGGVGLLSTEMLSAARIQNEDPKISPYLIITKREHPISYQFLIYRADHVKKAVYKAEELGADAIDINLGCGAPKVRKKGGGIGLASDFKRLEEIIKEIKKHTKLPVTAKIRIGKELNPKKFIANCQFLENIGIDAIYIHARLEKEPFCRPAKWSFVSCLAGEINIPYIINGGIFSIDDAKKAQNESKADGIMIGRAAAIRPWIFKEIELGKAIKVNLPEIFFKFVDYLKNLFPEDRRLGRLKEFTHYFSKNYAFGNRLAMAVQRSSSMEEALDVAEEFFRKNEKL